MSAMGYQQIQLYSGPAGLTAAKNVLRQRSKTDIINSNLCSGCHSELGLALYFTETLDEMKRWLIQDRLKSSICWDQDSFQPISAHYCTKW